MVPAWYVSGWHVSPMSQVVQDEGGTDKVFF